MDGVAELVKIFVKIFGVIRDGGDLMQIQMQRAMSAVLAHI